MKVFLDTNFVIDYLLRPEFKTISQEFLAYGAERHYEFYVSYLSVANFAYIARKLSVSERDCYIQSICELFKIVPCNSSQVYVALRLKASDFEDALQYAAALDAGCECIISRNAKDFDFSTIPVKTAAEAVN